MARVGEQVAEALAYAHGQGILHRDIKPSNLLLDLRGTVWVTDFGLAKSNDTDDLTQAGDFVGTLRYMAPERFEGQGDHRADVYALGLTLYELLTLKPAFTAENRAKLIEQVIAASPPSPRSINPAIPRDLETIVLKAMQRDPAMRYPSATELADDLRRFTEDRPIFARRASSAEQAWRWCRRNPAVASLSAALVVALSIGLAGVTQQWLRARDHAAQAQQKETEANEERDAAKTAREQMRSALYASDMNLVQAAWEADNVGRVVELLERQMPREGERDLRGFEWHYWRRRCRADLRTTPLKGMTSRYPIFSRDGARVAAAVEVGGRTEVHLWDTTTGEVRLRLHDSAFDNQKAYNISVAFNTAATRIATAVDNTAIEVKNSQGAVLTIWDTTTGEKLRTISNLTFQFAGTPTFSDDGTRIAASFFSGRDERMLKVWDAATLREVITIPYPKETIGALGLAFRPDGQHIAAVLDVTDWSRPDQRSESQIKVWDTSTGKELVSVPRFHGYSSSLAYSPDGIRIAAGCWGVSSGQDRLRIWSAADGKELPAPKGADDCGARMVFSPDGSRLVGLGSSSIAKVWDTATGELRLTLKGHTASVRAAAFAQAGTRLLTTSLDGTVKVWDAMAGDEQRYPLLGEGASYQFAYCSPDLSRIAVCEPPVAEGPHTIRVQDSLGQKVHRLAVGNYLPMSLAFSPDSSRLVGAVYDHDKGAFRVIMWDMSNGTELFTIPEIKWGPSRGMGGGVVFSPEGTRIAAQLQVSGPDLSVLKVWDSATGRENFALQRGLIPGEAIGFNAVAFSPDSKQVVSLGGFQDGVLKFILCDAENGRELRTFSAPGSDHAGSTAFSSDGRQLATVIYTSDDRGQIRVWDITSGTTLLTLKGHTGFVGYVTFSPDGRRIATCAQDDRGGRGQVKVWDATTGHELLTLKHDGLPVKLAFSPDGTRLSMVANGVKTPTGVVTQSWDATPLPAGR